MKKTIFLTFALCFLASFAFAQATTAVITKEVTIKGIVIDNACLGANKDKAAEFVKTHPKSCALMPDCAKSGYSIVTEDGKVYKFDKNSNKKVEEFLKKEDSKTNVVINAKDIKGELNLISIENQK